jgi:hypothetical protein
MDVLARQRIDLTAPPHPFTKNGGPHSTRCCNPGRACSPAICRSVARPYGVSLRGGWTVCAGFARTSFSEPTGHDDRC